MYYIIYKTSVQGRAPLTYATFGYIPNILRFESTKVWCLDTHPSPCNLERDSLSYCFLKNHLSCPSLFCIVFSYTFNRKNCFACLSIYQIPSAYVPSFLTSYVYCLSLSLSILCVSTNLFKDN